MVGCKNEQNRVVAMSRGKQRRKRDCRSRIAADRLQKDRCIFPADQPHLFGRQERCSSCFWTPGRGFAE
jgi:hypothetical protein